MSALARICAARGAQVTGSDADTARLDGLAAAGCAVRPGHGAPPPLDSTCVVVSTAIGDDNPEVAAARAAGIRVVHRAQVLAALTDGRGGVAVTGTHGKSSTAATVATVFTGGPRPVVCHRGDAHRNRVERPLRNRPAVHRRGGRVRPELPVAAPGPGRDLTASSMTTRRTTAAWTTAWTPTPGSPAVSLPAEAWSSAPTTPAPPS